MRREISVKLSNRNGLHARPAATLVDGARKFKAVIRIEKGGKQADAKSILGLVSLDAEYGDSIKITVEGEDADEAIKSLLGLLKELK